MSKPFYYDPERVTASEILAGDLIPRSVKPLVKWHAEVHDLQGIGSHISVNAEWNQNLVCGCEKHIARVVVQPDYTLHEVVEEITLMIEKWEGRCPHDR